MSNLENSIIIPPERVDYYLFQMVSITLPELLQGIHLIFLLKHLTILLCT